MSIAADMISGASQMMMSYDTACFAICASARRRAPPAGPIDAAIIAQSQQVDNMFLSLFI